MPTPEEPTLPPSPPSERPGRQPFASCPPEEERESHAPREDSEEDDGPTVTGAEREAIVDHAIAQEPTPEPEMLPESSIPESRGNDKVVGDAIDAPSSVASPDAAESDAPQAQVRADGEAQLPPLYLNYGPDHERVCAFTRFVLAEDLTNACAVQLPPSQTSSFLRPGSKFHGTQQSDRQVYDVQVEIKDVDMAESFLCGYLRIQGACKIYPDVVR